MGGEELQGDLLDVPPPAPFLFEFPPVRKQFLEVAAGDCEIFGRIESCMAEGVSPLQEFRQGQDALLFGLEGVEGRIVEVS